MTLGLPTVDEAVSARSSVVLAICQVRFEQRPEISESAAIALAFHSKLGGAAGRYPKVQQSETANRIVLGVGPGMSQETPRSAGWTLASSSDAWGIGLQQNNAGLQTDKYDGWEDFSGRLAEMLEALTEVIEPALEQRLGLRFVDRLRLPDVKDPPGWQPYIAPAFLGPVAVDGLGAAVRAAQQQLFIDLGDGAVCNLRHGPAQPNEDGTCDYMFDCDLFREGGQPFDSKSVLSAVSTFKDQADRLFQAAATPDLLETIRR